MTALEAIKKQIAEQINKALGEKIITAPALIYPPDPKLGDLSLACFEVAKRLDKSPVELANWLVGEIRIGGFIAGLKAAGPYLNININKEKLTERILNEIDKAKEAYGKNKSGKNKRVMIEFSNANTHKEYHVGHLRNVCYGEAINKILSANGLKIIPVSYINDFGIHTAKTLWAYLEFFKDKKIPDNKGYFLGQIYAQASKEIEKDPLAKQKIGFMMKKIESRQGKEYALWRKTRKWSLAQFDKIYRDLNIKFEKIFYESEFIDRGMKTVEELYKKRVLKKSQGAIIADLEKYGLGVLIFLRSDGTSMYPVADVPLAREKFKKYRLDKSIYVVDKRQSLYFKQLVKVLEILGNKKEILHLGYDVVKLPSGMMSSRIGRVITYEDLKEQVFSAARKETKKRHTDWSDKKIDKTAFILAIGAIKFEMIKVKAEQIITFDINQALRFDGYTAGYIQYTGARINSINRKINSKTKITKIKPGTLKHEKEYRLIMKLAKYPEVVKKAGAGYDPAEIAKYLFELAQDFNDYYHSAPVLKAEEEVKNARLALIKRVSQTIKNGLALLGIEAVEEM